MPLIKVCNFNRTIYDVGKFIGNEKLGILRLYYKYLCSLEVAKIEPILNFSTLQFFVHCLSKTLRLLISKEVNKKDEKFKNLKTNQFRKHINNFSDIVISHEYMPILIIT